MDPTVSQSDEVKTMPENSQKLLTTPLKPRSGSTTPKRKTGTSSPFFTPTKKPRPPPGTVSCIVAPPLSAATFGLIQEELAHEPFQLLVAIIFLNRTRGSVAIPLYRKLVKQYPTPQALAAAAVNDIAVIMQPLGLHNQRAATIVQLAKIWITIPPVKGWRFKTPSYPPESANRTIKDDEVLSDEDPRDGAYEIGHIPGLGQYAYDSWRIFCRDRLRDVANSWNGEGANAEFEPEWKRVLPKDKELRAYIFWMWLKEGFKFDPLTGEKEVASEDLMRRAELGGLKWNEDDL